VSPTAGGHLVAHPATPNQPTAKGSGNVSVPTASMETAKRRKSSDPLGEVSGPLNGAPAGTTATTAQVGKTK